MPPVNNFRTRATTPPVHAVHFVHVERTDMDNVDGLNGVDAGRHRLGCGLVSVPV